MAFCLAVQRSYVEGDEATLTATPAMFCVFDGWSDGNGDSPRTITVTQDTLLTALFHYDSAWAEGIETAGTLEFTVSPNPTKGHLTVKTNLPDNYEVIIYDMNGKTLLSKKSDTPAVDIDLNTLPAGQYRLLLRGKDRYGVKTIIKN